MWIRNSSHAWFHYSVLITRVSFESKIGRNNAKNHLWLAPPSTTLETSTLTITPPVWFMLNKRYLHMSWLRNKSWKPECVFSFNMDWRILVFYPKPKARDKIYQYPPTHVKNSKHILASMIYFDSDMSKNTNRSIFWLEDGNLYLRSRKMSHTIYATNGKVSHIHRRMCEWEYNHR
jgi:hypothetical protein